MGTNMNRIALVMATYNGEPFLRQQLDSLFDNTYQNWRLYVCDDGSMDTTLSILKEYQDRFPERIQIRRNQVTLRSAHNFYAGLYWAYSQEKADYYMFCDQDDVWDVDKIEVTLKAMHQMEKEKKTEYRSGKEKIPLLVYTDSRIVDLNGKLLSSSFQSASHYHSEHCDFAHLLMENKMSGCTQMLNSALVEIAFSACVLPLEKEKEACVLEPEFPIYIKMHDWWFGLVAAAFGQVRYVDRTTMDYRQHGRNVIGGSDFGNYIKRRIKKITKQQHAIREDIRQGAAFREWFGSRLPKREQKILDNFCALRTAGFWHRRYILFCYPFRKSGFIRNMALFLFV